jgi:hypothetical protein
MPHTVDMRKAGVNMSKFMTRKPLMQCQTIARAATHHDKMVAHSEHSIRFKDKSPFRVLEMAENFHLDTVEI